jgi:hypothetical protein
MTGTIKALGYPCRDTFAAWLDELHPEARCDVSIGCSPGGIWETGVLDASDSQENLPDEQS